MGRLERYEQNIMTWVKPNNNKLIDRAVRYIMQLLSKKEVACSYEEVTYKLFEVMETIRDDEPIVLKTLEALNESASK